MKPEDVLQNPSVVQELTKDGSSINDWGKFTTTVPVSMPTGQPIQVHFYRNIVTGEVNYTHQDFKIKEEVGLFYGRPTPDPSVFHGI